MVFTSNVTINSIETGTISGTLTVKQIMLSSPKHANDYQYLFYFNLTFDTWRILNSQLQQPFTGKTMNNKACNMIRLENIEMQSNRDVNFFNFISL